MLRERVLRQLECPDLSWNITTSTQSTPAQTIHHRQRSHHPICSPATLIMLHDRDKPNHEDVKSQIKAALADPQLTEEGFETSKVIAMISVLLKDVDLTGGAVTNRSLPSRRKLVKMMKTCYQFVIRNSAGNEVMWFIDMKKKGRVAKGKAPFKPDVTIWCSDKDLVALASGEMNPQKLYAAKRIKIKGNLDKALKVERILSYEREKILLAGQEPSPSSITLSKSIGPRPSKL